MLLQLELERAQAQDRRPEPEVKPIVNKVTTHKSPGLKAHLAQFIHMPAGFFTSLQADFKAWSSLLDLIITEPAKKPEISQAWRALAEIISSYPISTRALSWLPKNYRSPNISGPFQL